jgi:microcystin-dependent protein
MASPFVAEIRIFGFNFPPTGWAFCNGQLLPISQNTALFSLLGTVYGGDGKTTFGLPNLQGSAPLQQGQGQGLSLYDQGQSGGEESVTLLTSEIPLHVHTVISTASPGTQNSPTGGIWAKATILRQPQTAYSDHGGGAVVAMSPQAYSIAGSSLPHNNMPPYLTLNFCIALQGVFPARP